VELGCIRHGSGGPVRQVKPSTERKRQFKACRRDLLTWKRDHLSSWSAVERYQHDFTVARFVGRGERSQKVEGGYMTSLRSPLLAAGFCFLRVDWSPCVVETQVTF